MRLYHGSNVEVKEPIEGCMTERQYIAFLGVLVLPSLVAEIGRRLDISEPEATERLYRSEFYEKLANEKLKLWHYSPVMLGEMFFEAEKTGVIPYPEEA